MNGKPVSERRKRVTHVIDPCYGSTILKIERDLLVIRSLAVGAKLHRLKDGCEVQIGLDVTLAIINRIEAVPDDPPILDGLLVERSSVLIRKECAERATVVLECGTVEVILTRAGDHDFDVAVAVDRKGAFVGFA